MSKLSDDLSQSLKEARAHAMGEGPGTEHTPPNPRGSDAGDVQAEAGNDADEAD